MLSINLLAAAVTCASALADGIGPPKFTDVTESVGLGSDVIPETVSRLCFADLNNDGYADIVIDRWRVFLNLPDAGSPIGRRFAEVPPERTGLLEPMPGTVTVFADLDNDGNLDAIVTEYIDSNHENWTDHGRRTRWQQGHGDGTFGTGQRIEAAPPRTTCSIAVGDVSCDGNLELYLGNWYSQYGEMLEAYPNDLLLGDGVGGFSRVPLPDDDAMFDEEWDAGGRPTYGTMITDIGRPTLLELNYGRRWNREWVRLTEAGSWSDVASVTGFDGDQISHGEYPAWAVERMAQRDPPIELESERPFRSNGNTFDCAVGDIDNDGDFDVFLAEITHGWAGGSSDRSRFLLNQRGMFYRSDARLSVDRVHEEVNNWNQGDLFCALADLDHDSRLDLVLSSGDYPDDQRLRVYLQQPDGTFVDSTAALGIDHDGSQQISLADVDGDGDLDLLAGQTFNRYSAEQKAGRKPHPKLLVNNATGERNSVTLRLRGDGERVNRHALGAIVKATLPDGTTISRQLIGIGGHAGKQHDFLVHLGLGEHEAISDLIITWPTAEHTEQVFFDVPSGPYTLRFGDELKPVLAAEPSETPEVPALPAPPPTSLSGEGYLGLSLRDIPDGHTVVSWILPGPLHGEGIAAPAVDLARPDLLVAVNGEAMNADDFRDFIRTSAPGGTVTIQYRRSNARSGTIPDTLNHEDEVRTLEVVLESRDEWTGTITRGRGHETIVTFDDAPRLDPFDEMSILGEAVAEHELSEPLQTLTGVFQEWQERDDDYHSLSRVRAGFEDPFCLPELAEIVTARMREVPGDPFEVAQVLVQEQLDLHGQAEGGGHGWISSPRSGLELDLLEPMGAVQVKMRLVLGDAYSHETFAQQSLDLLRVPRRTFYISGAEARDHIAVIRQSMGIDFEQMPGVIGHFALLADGVPDSFDEFTAQAPPPALVGIVEGNVLLATYHEPVGWLVIGSNSNNRYDMAKLAIVIDPGGNDVYHATDLCLGTHAIIDLAGNDHYTGTPEQGPGGALLGASLIDDRAGDDVYEGEMLACGAAMYGVSLLLDRAGNDIYRGSEWSMGAGCYGAGMLIDLGNGNDQYLGDFLCQGVGGPRGFGCIIDEQGRDLYRANGPTPSAYGTAAVFQSFSQGVGWGYRQYAAGGIGMISDLGGDDRYEAGEFSQGGAYYYGLGILHDAGGRDLYYGNRYGQGFGVHQAVGMLVDEAGDDTYWSMTAASQGSAWDIGVGMLLDKAGNDSYQCDGLGQGGASQQAIAYLLDLGGTDRYVAGGGALQGRSGGNAYHFHETGAYSFSLLLDLGGKVDHYSAGRPNNAVTRTGEARADDPKNSPLHGLCIDR